MTSRLDEVVARDEHPAARTIAELVRRMPWWARVLAVFVAARLLTTVILLIMAQHQGANPWTGAQPGYVDFAAIWDGRWYDIVSETGFSPYGYTTALPRNEAGLVTENAWAFLPAYPFLVKVVATVLFQPWPVAAVLVSLAFGAGSALVLFRLLVRRLEAGTALFAVVLFCVAPVSPLMQLAYAESMYTFLLALALLLIVTRRYGILVPVLVVAGFTRPGTLALALALGLHVVWRWWRRRDDPFPSRERALAVVATAVAVVAGAAWPAIAGLVTGDASAYTDTELAWRSAYLGPVAFVPFAGWIQGVMWWFGTWWHLPVWLGFVLLGALICGFGAAMFLPSVRRLGVTVRLWCGSYALYLLAVFFPQTSTFRLLLPLFPLVGAIAQPRHPAYRVGMVALGIAGQVGWLLLCWGVDGLDWTPP